MWKKAWEKIHYPFLYLKGCGLVVAYTVVERLLVSCYLYLKGCGLVVACTVVERLLVSCYLYFKGCGLVVTYS